MLRHSKMQKYFKMLSRTYHAFIWVVSFSRFIQQLSVLQLLTHVLQSVKRLIQLHRHGHFGQVFTNVVPQNIPQVNIWGVGRRSRQTRTPPISKHASCYISVRHCWEEIQGVVVMRLRFTPKHAAFSVVWSRLQSINILQSGCNQISRAAKKKTAHSIWKKIKLLHHSNIVKCSVTLISRWRSHVCARHKWDLWCNAYLLVILQIAVLANTNLQNRMIPKTLQSNFLLLSWIAAIFLSSRDSTLSKYVFFPNRVITGGTEWYSKRDGITPQSQVFRTFSPFRLLSQSDWYFILQGTVARESIHNFMRLKHKTLYISAKQRLTCHAWGTIKLNHTPYTGISVFP